MSLSPLAGSASSIPGIVNQRQQDQARILASLASGKSINGAADNPAGLIISQLLQSQGQGDSQALDNISQANAMAQTADGALGESQNLLDQMRGLALQAANSGTLDPTQSAVLNTQFENLGKALDRIASDTTFGNTPLLDGSFTNKTVQTGASADQTLSMSIASNVTGSAKGFDRQGLGLAGADLSSPSAISDTLKRIDAASQEVGKQRGNLGALQSDTFDSLASSLSVQQTNLANANATIADTDYAQAATALAQNSIITQAGMAMLAQGNLVGQQMLRLLA